MDSMGVTRTSSSVMQDFIRLTCFATGLTVDLTRFTESRSSVTVNAKGVTADMRRLMGDFGLITELQWSIT